MASKGKRRPQAGGAAAETRRLDGGKPSKVTINDIARLAKVSKKTVSRVINNSPLVRDETRDKVQAIIAEHGFAPDPQARALAFRRSYLVALIYDNPSPQYVVNMQRGILDTLERTSFQLIVKPCDRGDAHFHANMRTFVEQQKLFGAILPPSVSEDEKLVAILNEARCPYVRIASVVLDSPDRMVETHDSEGAAAAARHIATLGHRLIAHVRGPPSFRSSHERLRGFKAGLAEFGLELDPKLTFEGAYTFDSGVSCAQQLLERPPGARPTAVFAGNDEMAMGVYQAVRRAGFDVPGDLSIVGFDDTPMASRIWPPLTTVRLPIREMGKAAAALLIGSPEAPANPVSFVPEIIVRQSTAPVRRM